jgi:hypothetical protein
MTLPVSPGAGTHDRARSTPPVGSWLARDAARRALDRALPGIAAQLGDPEVSGTGFLHLVLMDPGLPPGTVPFEEAILLEHSIGDRDRWDADYARFARAKAQLSWRHGVDGHVLQSRYPHLLLPGETTLWGGICLDGITVGVSGAQPWYDEAFGLTLAAYLRAEIKRSAAAASEQKVLFAPGPAVP